MNAKLATFASLLLMLAAVPAAADVTQTPYQIHGGGMYQYKPASLGPGIPGGMPSDYQLDFGIGGTFDYQLETNIGVAPTAKLLNLNLFLTGNEAIQAAPPALVPVTADRVETYLAGHLFVEDFIGGLLHLESSTVPGLKLTDSLSGNIAIDGGYDGTFVDGDAIQFQFGAVAVPEPAAIPLLAVAALALLRRRR